MAIYIKIAVSVQIFQDGGKVFQISLLLRASLIKSGIIGIFSVADMGGAYDEVVIVFFGKGCIAFGEVRLQAKLYAEKKRDAASVYITEFQKIIQIGVGIQLEKTVGLPGGHRVVKVIVLCETHFGQSQFDPSEDHLLHRRVGIPGKRRM